jgi:hypothetical protein
MTRRHAAALALVGWYLMVPPEQGTKLPMSQWDHVGGFDKIDDCQDMRNFAREPADTQQKDSGLTSKIFGDDPIKSADDENANVAAIRQYVATGQEPATVQIPSYGPIGSLLQSLGLRSRSRPVPEELRDRMHLAKRFALGQCVATDDPRLKEK